MFRPVALLAFLLSTAAVNAQAAAQACAAPQQAFGGANGTPTTVLEQLVVPTVMTIGDVHVAVRISHAWISDVHLELTSPAGTVLELQAGSGGNADDLDLIYADAGVPHGSVAFTFGCHMQIATGSLAALAGENTTGTWQLRVTDNYPSSDDGVLESWCLSFYSHPQTALPPPVQNIHCVRVGSGAALSWTNPIAYAGLDVLLDGVQVAQLPGTTSTHTLAQAPGNASVQVRGFLAPGGAPSCGGESTIPAPLPPPRTEKVVLVIIDGLRYEDGLGHPTRQYVPMMDALAAQGTIIEPFLNDNVTSTNRAIPAIMCGSWQPPVTQFDPVCNSNNLFSARPMVQEYFRRQLNRPADDCQYILGPYCPWRGSEHPAYGSAYWPTWVATSGGDDANWAAVQPIIANDSPTLLTFYLPSVDIAGHGGVWANYTAAIQNADQIVGNLWSLLQTTPEYAGKTTMIITNDHGRHWFNFAGHGDGCTGCRTIQLLAIGPAIKAGFVSTTPRAIPDITPTIGALLGFHTEFADGQVMEEIFSNVISNVTPFGLGCGGLTVTSSPPLLGQVADIVTGSVPASSILIGNTLSFTKLDPPTDLTALGMPSCFLHVSGGSSVGLSGTTTRQLSIPNDPTLLSVLIHAQSWALAPGTTPLGVVTSHGLTLLIGDL